MYISNTELFLLKQSKIQIQYLLRRNRLKPTRLQQTQDAKSYHYSNQSHFHAATWRRLYLKLIMKNNRWLKFGLVGNLISYGLGTAFMLYLGWIVYDISENASTKMDEDLAKQLFTFSDADLKQSAKAAKMNYTKRKQERLLRQKERSLQRKQQNKKAEFI